MTRPAHPRQQDSALKLDAANTERVEGAPCFNDTSPSMKKFDVHIQGWENLRVRPDGPLLSVVVPCKNEEGILHETHRRLVSVLQRLTAGFEIIYVDDGSSDGSWAVLRALAAGDSSVRLVRLRKNFGQTPALSAGIAHARYPILVTLDADQQNDPRDIPRLLF